jgi:hypothetical protein
MTRRRKIWAVIAGLFTVMNVGGAGYAIALGEPMHAAAHVGALLVGYLVWRLVSPAPQAELPEAGATDQRLELLQQSVDAIALEVERISEGQRFITKLQAERAEQSPPRQNPL